MKILFKQIRYIKRYEKILELKNGNIDFTNFNVDINVDNFTPIGITKHYRGHYVSFAMFKKDVWWYYNDMDNPMINNNDRTIKNGNEINIFYVKNDLKFKNKIYNTI